MSHPPSTPTSPPPSLSNPTPSKAAEASEVETFATQRELELQGLSGTKTILCGPAGAGKTYSLVTSIKAGLELFVVGTEPGFEESLLEAVEALGADRSKLHYAYIAPAKESWGDLKDMAQKISMMGYEGVSKLKASGGLGYQQFMQLLSLLANFKDQHGDEFGDVTTWGPDRMLAVDSMSGLNDMAMSLVVGGKPTAHQGEWGTAMDTEYRFIKKCCSDTRCFFVITAHTQRVMDELQGRPIVSVDALGTKLAPRLPRWFSDFVLAYREGDKFFWSTANTNMDLKTRTLPMDDHIRPDFGQIVSVWRSRREKAQAAHDEQLRANAEHGAVTETATTGTGT